LDEVEALLTGVVPRAASTAERREARWFHGDREGTAKEAVERRWARWVESAAGGDEEGFNQLLLARGLEKASARRGLLDGHLDRRAKVPGWVHALREVLVASKAQEIAEDTKNIVLQSMHGSGKRGELGEGDALSEVVGSCVSVGRRWFSEAERGEVKNSLIESLVDPLLAELSRRMFQLLANCCSDETFWNEHHSEGTFGLWRELLNAFPAIGRVVGVAMSQWWEGVVELRQRAVEDLHELESLWVQAEEVEMKEPVDSGDYHDGGRVVRVLRDRAGRLIVYKPRDLRIVEALEKFLSGLDKALRVPRGLYRADYCWQEYQAERLPQCEEEWSSLAFEVGMWTCLFEMLGSSDMHRGNVMVCGGRLIPIDLETLLPFELAGKRELMTRIVGSRSGLLTSPLLNQGRLLFGDLGLLADRNLRPLHKYLGEIQGGFWAMLDTLRQQRDSCEMLLKELEKLSCRAVVRNSWVYARLLQDSLAAPALADGIARDLVLERLWRAHLHVGLGGELIEAEEESLRDMDIPLFQFMPGERLMRCKNRRVIESGLERTSVSILRENLDQLFGTDVVWDIDAIYAQAFCAQPDLTLETGEAGDSQNDIKRASIGRKGHDEESETKSVWLNRALNVGDEILSLLASREGVDKWDAGVVYLEGNDAFSLAESRGWDCLSGNLGVAIVLGQLYRASGVEKFAKEASQLTESVLGIARSVVRSAKEKGELANCQALGSVYTGVISMAYGLYCLREMNCTPDLQDELGIACQEVVEYLVGIKLPDLGRVGGWLDARVIGSLLTVMSTVSPMLGRIGCELSGVEDVMGQCVKLLIDNWESYLIEIPVTWMRREFLPSSRGIALLGLRRFAELARNDVSEFVEACLDEWTCRSSVDREIALALGRDPGPMIAARTSFDLVNGVEEGLLACRSSGNMDELWRARGVGMSLVNRREEYGRWFPEKALPDRYRLSALWGLSSVAYGFLGLAHVPEWYSLRLVERPVL